MKLFRLVSIATSVALVASLSLSQGPLDRKPRPGGGGGSPPPQSGPKPDNKPNNPPPSQPDNKPNNPPPSRPEQGPRPDNDRPRPKPDNDRPKPDIDRPKPRPDNGPGGGGRPDQGPRPDNDRPKPRPINEGPKPDIDRPRPGGGGSNNDNNGPGGRPDQGPRPGGSADRPRPTNGGNNDNGLPGRWNNDSPLGRINDGRTNDRPIGRQDGKTYGGSVSNSNRGNERVSRPTVHRAPVDIFRGGLGNQVRRDTDVRYANRYRSGYYHYRRDWRDDNFWFNWYVFDPYRAHCYVSPWYYYHHLPAYVNTRCVTVPNLNFTPWYGGTVYNWYRPTRWENSYSYSNLDYALEDLTRAFENFDVRAIRRLLPYRDRVAIFVDGQYNYSMTAEDFEDFLIDAIESTDTRRYEIVRVERRGREAEVQARHDYIDPWGNRESVYHTYRLEENRGSYVITRFGTSYYR